MILNVNDDEFFEAPSAEQIVVSVKSLPVEQYAILTSGEHWYMQTYHHADGTFQLEYREGGADKHFAAIPDSLTVNLISQAFVSYLSGTDDWRATFSWEKVEFDDDFEGDITSQNGYLLNGEEYRKVVVGDEKQSVLDVQERCSGCNARLGEFHYDGCNREECPRCHGLLHACDCE